VLVRIHGRFQYYSTAIAITPLSHSVASRRWFLRTAALTLMAAACMVNAAPFTEVTPVVEINRVLILGAAHPLAKKAELSALADEAQADAARRQASWPTVGVFGGARSSDALPSLDTPLGTIITGKKNSGQIQAQLRLPLVNPSADLRAQADALTANASSFGARRIANLQAMIAANVYLDVLALRAQQKSEYSLSESRLARLDQARGMFKSGRILKSDVLKLQLELEQTSQNIVRLQGLLAIALRELTKAIGSDRQVDAAPLAWVPSTLAPASDLTEDTINESLHNREDVQALRERITALGKLAASIAAEQRRPNVSLVAQHDQRRGISLLPERENSIGVQINIPLYSSGAVESRQLAKLRERDALELELIDIERGARLELERARESFNTAQNLKKLAAVAIESATETLATRNALYNLGRLNVDDLLGSESELERQKAYAAIIEIDIVRAWLQFQYALGKKLTDLHIPGRQ
jgi:outer membrane protein